MTDTSTYAPAVPGGRPAMPSMWAELVDNWMEPNGMVGWIPDGSEVVVQGGQVSWSEWRHRDPTSGPWDKDVMIAADLWPAGHSGDNGDEPVVNKRTVPLKVPVDDRVRELFGLSTLTLVER